MSDRVAALWTAIQELSNDERGTTAVEYVMLAALIAAAIVTVVAALGDTINTALS